MVRKIKNSHVLKNKSHFLFLSSGFWNNEIDVACLLFMFQKKFQLLSELKADIVIKPRQIFIWSFFEASLVSPPFPLFGFREEHLQQQESFQTLHRSNSSQSWGETLKDELRSRPARQRWVSAAAGLRRPGLPEKKWQTIGHGMKTTTADWWVRRSWGTLKTRADEWRGCSCDWWNRGQV